MVIYEPIKNIFEETKAEDVFIIYLGHAAYRSLPFKTRAQKIQAVLPQELAALVIAYELSAEQENFYCLRLWFQKQEKLYRPIEKTKWLLIYELLVLMFLNIVSIVILDPFAHYQQSTVNHLVFAFTLINFFLSASMVALLCLHSEKYDQFDDFVLYKYLRYQLLLHRENITTQDFQIVLESAQDFVERPYGSENYLFKLAALPLIMALMIGILSKLMVPENADVGEACIVCSSIGLGLSTFGLYGNSKRQKALSRGRSILLSEPPNFLLL